MNARDLLRMHMALECIGVNAEGLLVRMEGPCPDDIARFYVAQLPDGFAAYARHDVPPATRARLAALPPQAAFDDPEAIQRILAADAPCERAWRGRSCVFPRTLSPRDFPDVVRLGPADRALAAAWDPNHDPGKWPLHAIVLDGRIVAACTSSREDHAAAEAWVFTHPDFRGRGFARRVTAAWAHDARCRGKVPFYSHHMENLPSEAVARSLGLIRYIADVAFA